MADVDISDYVEFVCTVLDAEYSDEPDVVNPSDEDTDIAPRIFLMLQAVDDVDCIFTAVLTEPMVRSLGGALGPLTSMEMIKWKDYLQAYTGKIRVMAPPGSGDRTLTSEMMCVNPQKNSSIKTKASVAAPVRRPERPTLDSYLVTNRRKSVRRDMRNGK